MRIFFPQQINLVLTGRIPSKKNGTRRIKRGNRIFTVPSERHEIWERCALLELNLQKKVQKPLVKCSCILEFFPPDRIKADLTNKADSVMDVLVKAEIIKDDNWFNVRRNELVMVEVDRKNPRCEITILVESI